VHDSRFALCLRPKDAANKRSAVADSALRREKKGRLIAEAAFRFDC